MPKAERRRRREEAAARGVGNDNGKKKGERMTFWTGMLMGAATATGGFFALKALEKTFGRKKQEALLGNPALNPAPADEARARLLAAATGNPQLAAAPAPKPAVTKRTIIEEMVEDLEQ